MDDHSPLEVRTTRPRPWEEETTFDDVLYEWMGRAPWLAISAAAHVILLVILVMVPWSIFERAEELEIEARIEQPVEDPFEDPPEEEPEEIVEEEPLDEPVLVDAELVDEEPDEQDLEVADGDPDHLVDDLELVADLPLLGIGGGGDKFGDRFGDRKKGRGGPGAGTQQAVEDGLEWLRRHQDADGKWSSAGFSAHCAGSTPCDGPGHAVHDVGNTGLALLAFLGDGHTTMGGRHREVVSRGVKWLTDQQDESGLIGERIGKAFLYDHAIASLALCEVYYFSRSPLLRGPAQRSIDFITRARNPYGAWRYEAPPNGESDTSVTGWMVFALKSAEEGGLRIDAAAYDGAISWIDEVTDGGTGRVGYDARGSRSSRVPKVNDHFPTDTTECMTAVGLLCRFFLGQDPRQQDVMVKHAELLLRALPEWDPSGRTNDMYYWYYGTYAMFQMGAHDRRYWETWNAAMKPAVVETQRGDGDARGSWDPIGPWGHAGGRVYATASLVLCLEVYYRYAQVLGARN